MTVSDSPRSRIPVQATKKPPREKWVGRTKSDVASRGTVVTTCGLRSGAPSAPSGTTKSSDSPVRSEATTHTATPVSCAHAVNGPIAVLPIAASQCDGAGPRTSAGFVLGGRRVPRALGHRRLGRVSRRWRSVRAAGHRRDHGGGVPPPASPRTQPCGVVTDGTTREAVRTVPTDFTRARPVVTVRTEGAARRVASPSRSRGRSTETPALGP